MARASGNNIPPERAAAGLVLGEMIDKDYVQRKAFAADIGIDAKRLSHIVNGNKKIDTVIAKKLASKLPKDERYFLTLEGNVFDLRPDLKRKFPPQSKGANLDKFNETEAQVELNLRDGSREMNVKFTGDEGSVHRLMKRFFS